MDPGDLDKLKSKALNLGLDLQGGIHLVMQVDTSDMKGTEASDAVDKALTVIANRVNQFGLTEPVVQREGENRIIIELPGMRDVERAKNLIGQTARLEFKLLKSEALKHTLAGDWPRYRMNHETGEYHLDANTEPYTGVIVGVRADEEGSRSKERYFSVRGTDFRWNYKDQAPEPWDFYRAGAVEKEHIRVHPMLHWTELDVWKYIEREKIPIVSLYLAKNGKRYRSIGCLPCCVPVDSKAATIPQIIRELETTHVAERSGRVQDQEETYTMQKLRSLGYM